MPKYFLTIVVALCATILTYAQSEAYEFKSIGILPFGVLGYQDADEVAVVENLIEDTFDQLQIPAAVLNTKETSAILSSKGISKENIHTYTLEDLSELLGVDALIIGEVNRATSGEAHKSEIVLQLVEGVTGQVIWRAAKNMRIPKSEALLDEVISAANYNEAIPY